MRAGLFDLWWYRVCNPDEDEVGTGRSSGPIGLVGSSKEANDSNVNSKIEVLFASGRS